MLLQKFPQITVITVYKLVVFCVNIFHLNLAWLSVKVVYKHICDNSFDHCVLFVREFSVIKISYRFYDDTFFELLIRRVEAFNTNLVVQGLNLPLLPSFLWLESLIKESPLEWVMYLTNILDLLYATLWLFKIQSMWGFLIIVFYSDLLVGRTTKEDLRLGAIRICAKFLHHIVDQPLIFPVYFWH